MSMQTAQRSGGCPALVSPIWETEWRVRPYAVCCQLKCSCPSCLGGCLKKKKTLPVPEQDKNSNINIVFVDTSSLW